MWLNLSIVVNSRDLMVCVRFIPYFLVICLVYQTISSIFTYIDKLIYLKNYPWFPERGRAVYLASWSLFGLSMFLDCMTALQSTLTLTTIKDHHKVISPSSLFCRTFYERASGGAFYCYSSCSRQRMPTNCNKPSVWTFMLLKTFQQPDLSNA